MDSYIDEPGLIQIVTKESKHREFMVGDVIIPQADGTILCLQGGGWIESEDVKAATEGMESMIHTERYQQKIQKLKEEIEQCEAILRRADETSTP